MYFFNAAYALDYDNPLISSNYNITSNRSYRREYGEDIKNALEHHQPAKQHDTESTENPIEGDTVPILHSENNPAIDLFGQLQFFKHQTLKRFQTLQEWEGYVLEVNESEFTARLLDLTAGATEEDEEATIPLEEISETDHKNLYYGSIFRWVIGYEYSVSGVKRRISQIVFRDLPITTASDIAEGKEWARKIARSIK